MKSHQILAAIAALAAAHALAQPTDVPKASCEPKPVYPGLKAMKSDVEAKALENQVKNYKDCVVKYISERKTAAKAHLDAENAAAKEYNDTIGKFRSDQEAALKDQEAAKKAAEKNEPTSPSGKARSY